MLESLHSLVWVKANLPHTIEFALYGYWYLRSITQQQIPLLRSTICKAKAR